MLVHLIRCRKRQLVVGSLFVLVLVVEIRVYLPKESFIQRRVAHVINFARTVPKSRKSAFNVSSPVNGNLDLNSKTSTPNRLNNPSQHGDQIPVSVTRYQLSTNKLYSYNFHFELNKIGSKDHRLMILLAARAWKCNGWWDFSVLAHTSFKKQLHAIIIV